MIRNYHLIWLGVLGFLLAVVSFVAFTTHNNTHLTSHNSLIVFAGNNHLVIMGALVLLSIIFGFFWSTSLYKKIEQSEKTSKSILEVVLLFLQKEERNILDFLVNKGGKTTQAEISRLDGLNKVKAYRSLQRMQQKNLIDITPHGKVRYITLKKDILDLLVEKNA